MSTSSAERAAPRIAELQQKGIERNLELRVHVIAAIIREELAREAEEECSYCGGTCEVACSSTNYMPCPKCCGEPKGEGK